MPYSKAVLDHYENPRNVGKFDPSVENIGTGMVGGSCVWGCNEVTNKG